MPATAPSRPSAASTRPLIHSTAEVSPECELAEGVEIGPYCFLKGRVTLGPGVKLLGNNYIQGEGGPVVIGARTIIYPFACIGYEPQDFKFAPGSKTAGVVVGEDCLIREHVTIHAATNDHTPTRIGNKVFLMVNTHVAHDGCVGNNVVMVNGSGLAGHGVIEDNVTLGGNAVIHQFCRLGRLVMMSGDCAVSLDVPPFCMVSERNRIGGLNTVGLRRSGMPREHITELRKAFRDLLRNPMPRSQVIAELEIRGRNCPPIAEMARFIAASKRGICPGMGKPARDSLKQTNSEEPDTD
jgi:UDP-N-acetylglucosamine acyltransferase